MCVVVFFDSDPPGSGPSCRFTPPVHSVHAVCSRRRLCHARKARAAAAPRPPHAARRSTRPPCRVNPSPV
eukprot:4573532-Prymnesium_polylepis.1